MTEQTRDPVPAVVHALHLDVPPAPAPRDAGPAFTTRRVLEASVLALSFVLLFRALGAEPYEVPTGSMAPALLGHHRATTCPRCGHSVRVGQRTDDRRGADFRNAFCPNCGCDDLRLDLQPLRRGDQLLVNKSVFDLRSPRRWEMVVFRCPVEPEKAFVKRVVGLPGESVQVKGGDVYADGQLVRKTLAEAKAVRLPVFDLNYPPGPDGWARRWDAAGAGPGVGLVGNVLHLDARDADRFLWLGYRNWRLDEHKVSAVNDEYCYNGGEPGQPAETVHDFLIECDLEVLGGDGAVAFRVTDGQEELIVELPVGSAGEGARLGPYSTTKKEGPGEWYRTAEGFVLRPGKVYRIDLAFVDRRATLAVDGVSPFEPADLPAVARRRGVARPVQVGARGTDARVSNVRIGRDIHYTAAGKHAVAAPVRLGPGRYFVLGDNSANSDDNRFWSDAADNPVPVPEANLLGKPFLVHLPSRFVSRDGTGQVWEYDGLDWGRMRWLR